MCSTCESALREVLTPGAQIQTLDFKVQDVEGIEGDDVLLKGNRYTPAFHLSHAAALLHWLRDGHYICGIGAGTTSVKNLLKKGKVASCGRCSQNATWVRSALAAVPEVQRHGQSGLAPSQHP